MDENYETYEWIWTLLLCQGEIQLYISLSCHLTLGEICVRWGTVVIVNERACMRF